METAKRRPRYTITTSNKTNKKDVVELIAVWEGQDGKPGYWAFNKDLTEEQLVQAFRSVKNRESWTNFYDNSNRPTKKPAEFASVKPATTENW